MTQPFNCSVCNKEVLLTYTNKEELIKNKACFKCNFWIELENDKSLIVVQREFGLHAYSYTLCSTPHHRNGFGGTWWRIIKQDGTRIETCDLWSRGEIPKEFSGKFPINAELICIDQEKRKVNLNKILGE